MDESRKKFEALLKFAGFKHLRLDWDDDAEKYKCHITQRAFKFWTMHGPKSQEG